MNVHSTDQGDESTPRRKIKISLLTLGPPPHHKRMFFVAIFILSEKSMMLVGCQGGVIHFGGLIPLLPGCQLAGQTSPYLSVNWKASTSRKASSTDLPTWLSFIIILRIFPSGLMMNSPLSNKVGIMGDLEEVGIV